MIGCLVGVPSLLSAPWALVGAELNPQGPLSDATSLKLDLREREILFSIKYDLYSKTPSQGRGPPTEEDQSGFLLASLRFFYLPSSAVLLGKPELSACLVGIL